MMNTFFTGTLSLLLLTGSLQARTPQDTVTSRSYSLEEVVVTGTRNETDIRHLPMTVTVINRQKIERALQPSLLPVLTEQTPGLFTTARGILGFGVSGGAAGSISLRGISGGSGRLMVLIDGHPQYMGLFAHPISDAYQSFLAEQVEVLRGPASMLYGSNAMGGVINIVTRKMQEDGVKTHIRAGYGSYNTAETEATSRLKSGRFTAVVSASYNRTDGHRPHMGFEQYGGSAKLGYAFSEPWKVRANLNVTHFNASNPGPVTALLLDADQHITRGMTSLAVENQYEKTSGALSFFYNWGYHRINDGYTANPDDANNPKPYRFHSQDDMMGISWYQSTRLFKGNRLTVGADWFRFGGKAWNRYVEGSRKGERSDIVDKTENEVAGYVDFRQDFTEWLTLDAGVRAGHHSQAGTEWIPQAGLSFRLPHAISLKVSAGKGFRYPNIREMYMWGVANPDLKPESLWNYELAFSQHLWNGRLSYGFNLFYIDGKDLIISVPREGASSLNMNTGKIDNTGVEAQIAYRFHTAWSIDANYSYLHMDQPVLAAPEHKLYAGLYFTQNRWSVSTGVQYIAGLYTSTDPDTTEDFVLWNLRAQFRVASWLTFWTRGENLLAQHYEINAGYPMPKATGMAGININF